MPLNTKYLGPKKFNLTLYNIMIYIIKKCSELSTPINQVFHLLCGIEPKPAANFVYPQTLLYS
jgi:hypothetical protein